MREMDVFFHQGFGPGGIYGHSATYVEELGCILVFGGLRYLHFKALLHCYFKSTFSLIHGKKGEF
jgi:hypothetical protein